MTERLRRALARKKFFGEMNWSEPSRLANSFGNPIGKPLCIRSLRRWYRAVRLYNQRAMKTTKKDWPSPDFLRGMSGHTHQQDVSSKSVARAVRSMQASARRYGHAL